jgi:hypothetical protein
MSAAVTVLCGLIYAETQQQLRQAANDPQIELAEDAASKLAGGVSAASLLPTTTVDMATSVAPFVIVYDENDTVIASSATLDGTTPRLPVGVLSSARSTREDRVTWEPSPSVRIAAVVVPYPGGVVLAGRSLRDVEIRESDSLGIAAAGWLAAEVAITVAILGIEWSYERRRL